MGLYYIASTAELNRCITLHNIDRYPPVSSPLASAVHLYLRHSGIKLRDSKVFPGLMTEKEKWLPFFPKAKKVNVFCLM